MITLVLSAETGTVSLIIIRHIYCMKSFHNQRVPSLRRAGETLRLQDQFCTYLARKKKTHVQD